MCPPCTIRVNPNDRGVDCARTLFKHKIKKICFGFFTVILGDLEGEGTINLPPQATSRSPPLLGLNHYEQFRNLHFTPGWVIIWETGLVHCALSANQTKQLNKNKRNIKPSKSSLHQKKITKIYNRVNKKHDN